MITLSTCIKPYTLQLKELVIRNPNEFKFTVLHKSETIAEMVEAI